MKWAGSCSVCSQWNTLVEEFETPQVNTRFEAASKLQVAKPVRVSEVDKVSFRRLKTGFDEFDVYDVSSWKKPLVFRSISTRFSRLGGVTQR